MNDFQRTRVQVDFARAATARIGLQVNQGHSTSMESDNGSDGNASCEGFQQCNDQPLFFK
jgi:hypothetical protein